MDFICLNIKIQKLCFHSSYSSKFMFDLLAKSVLEVEIERETILRYVVRFLEMVVEQSCKGQGFIVITLYNSKRRTRKEQIKKRVQGDWPKGIYYLSMHEPLFFRFTFFFFFLLYICKLKWNMYSFSCHQIPNQYGKLC